MKTKFIIITVILLLLLILVIYNVSIRIDIKNIKKSIDKLHERILKTETNFLSLDEKINNTNIKFNKCDSPIYTISYYHSSDSKNQGSDNVKYFSIRDTEATKIMKDISHNKNTVSTNIRSTENNNQKKNMSKSELFSFSDNTSVEKIPKKKICNKIIYDPILDIISSGTNKTLKNKNIASEPTHRINSIPKNKYDKILDVINSISDDPKCNITFKSNSIKT